MNKMEKISRPVIYITLTVVVLAVIAAILASGTFSSGSGTTLMLFDEDLSDSALGWMIAIPVMVIVGMLVGAVMAGVAVITAFALAFAAAMVVCAMLLAFTPFVIFLEIPVLAIYGFVKLIQRDQRTMDQRAMTKLA